jgi:hypothetical protein
MGVKMVKSIKPIWKYFTIFCCFYLLLFTGFDYLFNVSSTPSSTDENYSKIEPLWWKTFGGRGYDCGECVLQTSDGGYIILGNTDSFSYDRYNIWLIKTDEQGNMEWNKIFRRSYNDYGTSIQQTVDGGYIIVGNTRSFDYRNWDKYTESNTNVWLIKTDEFGNELWNKTFGGADNDLARSVKPTSDEGYIIAGTTRSYGIGGFFDGISSSDIWLIKTDSNGNELWNKTFGNTSYEGSSTVLETSDGGYVIAGGSTSPITYQEDIILIKTDSSGKEEWNKTFGGNQSDIARSIHNTTDGGFIITGSTKSFGTGNMDTWLIKTNISGDEEWNRTFNNGSGGDVLQTADGGYIITGTQILPEWNILVIKTDSFGKKQWNKSFNYRKERAGGNSITQTSDGGFIVTGFIKYSKIGTEIILLKTDSEGSGGKSQEENEIPICRFIEPSNKDILSGAIEISGYAFNDDIEIKSVELRIDNGNWIEIPRNYNHDLDSNVNFYYWSYFWNTFTENDGEHTVYARAFNGEVFSYNFIIIFIENYPVAKNESPEPILWHTIGGEEYDSGNSIQHTSDGGYIIVGSTASYGAGGVNNNVYACDDAWLIKADSKGKEQWNRTFGGTKDDWGRSVQQTSDGGYIILGNTVSYGPAGMFQVNIPAPNIWLIKTDSEGNEQWNKTYGGTDYEFGESVQQTSEGGFIITGETWSFGAGESDLWLIKTDNTGEEKWNKTFGGKRRESGNSVLQTEDRGYIIVGAGKGVWLIKTDPDGNELLNKTFRGSEGIDILKTFDGGLIILGHIKAHSTSESDLLLIKTDSNFNEQWTKIFGGDYNDQARSILQTSDGGFIVAGELGYFWNLGNDIWLTKLNRNGSDEWDLTFGYTRFDQCNSVLQVTDNKYIIVGSTWFKNRRAEDLLILKIGFEEDIEDLAQDEEKEENGPKDEKPFLWAAVCIGIILILIGVGFIFILYRQTRPPAK